MDTPQNRNFFKLAFILLEIVTEQLRNVFKQEWDKQHPNNPWEDDNNSLQYFIQILKSGGTWKNIKSKVPKSGNRDDWDPTALFFMLLYSGALNLSPILKQHIDKLREIRNEYFGHPSTASLSDSKFQAVYNDIEVCMCGLNCSASIKKQMDDIRTGVMKVPEDYMKEKLCKIMRLETDNHKLLIQLKDSQTLILSFLVLCAMVFAMLFITHSRESIQPRNPTMDVPVSRTYFPESLKPNYYVGHDWEIDTATSLLTNGTYQMITITGPPAIGKTATAVAIGEVLKKEHNFQVAFVDFKQLNVNSTQIRKDMFRKITFSLGGAPEIDVDSLQQFITHLTTATQCPTLLILDNIQNILDFESKSKFFEVIKLCLGINKIKILVTSQKDFDIIGVSIYPIKLEPLSGTESKDLLHKLLPNLQESSVMEISKKAGGAPLLLELIGSLLREGVYEEYELIVKMEELPILVIVNDNIDLTESSNYFALLKSLFDHLDPDLQVTFIALGTIPMSFDQITANLVVKSSLTGTIKLHLLVNYNLLKKYRSATGASRYEMHSIISEFSRLVAKEKPQWSDIRCKSSVIFFDYIRQALQYSKELQHVLEAEGLVSSQILLAAQNQIHISCLNEDKWTNHMLPLVSSALQEHQPENRKDMWCIPYEGVFENHTWCTSMLSEGDEKLIYTTVILKAARYYEKHNLTQSISNYHLYLMIADKFVETDDEMIANVYAIIGYMSYELHKYTDAAFAFNKALTMRLQSDHHQTREEFLIFANQTYHHDHGYDHDTAVIARNLGMVYQILQQYNASIEPLCVSSQINDEVRKHSSSFLHRLFVIAYNWSDNSEACYQTIQMFLKNPNISEFNNCPKFYEELLVLGISASYAMSEYSTCFWGYTELVKHVVRSGLEYFKYTLDYLNSLSVGFYIGMMYGVSALVMELLSMFRQKPSIYRILIKLLIIILYSRLFTSWYFTLILLSVIPFILRISIIMDLKSHSGSHIVKILGVLFMLFLLHLFAILWAVSLMTSSVFFPILLIVLR